ncbi:MAG: DUF2267 domain-containing protein [Bacteroidetes bacterium]|nr:DUF2267 domain-containing protein [Bacteroidota bacterium]
MKNHSPTKNAIRSLYKPELGNGTRQRVEDEKWNRIYKTSTEERRRKIKTMNFEEYASEGNRFIKDVAEELNTNRNRAARITRAVLHALRDRLPADDSIQFAQGLPMMLKAIWLDQYDISKTPVILRHKEEFLDYIYDRDGLAAFADFPDAESIEESLQAVFFVLENNMSAGQMRHIKNMLNKEIVAPIEDY